MINGKRKNILYALLSMGLTITMLSGCYKDNVEELYPATSNCDTTALSYTVDIQPLIESFCYACHGSSNYTSLGGNIALQGHGNLSSVVDNGLLVSSITHDGSASFMPKNSNKLMDCSIAKIRTWVSQGAPEN